MICTGRLQTLFKDYQRKKYILQLECDSDVSESFEKLKDECMLDIKIVKHREKRSLDANGYYWSLVTEIARVKKLKNSEVHNRMLRDYGTPKLSCGQMWYSVIPDTDEAEEMALSDVHNHLRPTSEVKIGKDGTVWRTYVVMKGSSEYDTAEMAKLIDGTVQEAKQLGIETLTPDEVSRLKNEWRKRNE